MKLSWPLLLVTAWALTCSAATPTANNDRNTTGEDSILTVTAGSSKDSTISGAGAFGVVPEAANFSLVYELAVPDNHVGAVFN
jgi:hypothetical protein